MANLLLRRVVLVLVSQTNTNDSVDPKRDSIDFCDAMRHNECWESLPCFSYIVRSIRIGKAVDGLLPTGFLPAE